jgi:hypothetical protein
MIELIKSELIPIKKLVNNNGQIDGLPKNPRIIKDHKYLKLKASIEENPEFLGARELLVYAHENNFVILAGNMRFKVAQELNFKEIPCKIIPSGYTIDQLKAIVIKDNVSYGSEDWDALANEWDYEQLQFWGLDVPNFANENLDYSILDDDDLDSQINDMASEVKKAIQIEFESEHYEDAFELVKFWRKQGLYIGGFIMEKLKEEKEKL